jgi:hypothetical protein
MWCHAAERYHRVWKCVICGLFLGMSTALAILPALRRRLLTLLVHLQYWVRPAADRPNRIVAGRPCPSSDLGLAVPNRV